MAQHDLGSYHPPLKWTVPPDFLFRGCKQQLINKDLSD